MTDWLNGADRWRERQMWLPSWLDDRDWKTWIWHTAICVVLGHLVAFVFPVGPTWPMRFFVAAYFVREVFNVRERLQTNVGLKPLDHVMDVLSPLIGCELLAWAYR